MKNLSKKLALGAVVVCLVSTSAMAKQAKYFIDKAYGDSRSEAKKEARKSAKFFCSEKGGISSIQYGTPKKKDGEFVIGYEGYCNEY
jgi:hypothetical protein